MSFSSATKKELCRISATKKCCALAEACGVLLYCNAFAPNQVRIITESRAFAARLPILFQNVFGVAFDALPGTEQRGKLQLVITDPEKIARMFDLYGCMGERNVALHINFGILEEECCRAAFFRGAFFAGGSVTNPEKRYHLELVTSHYKVSKEMLVLLRDAGFSPKETSRGANQIIYFKQSEAIEDFLTLIGAPVAATQVMTTKVEKDLRNRVNRRVNCDAANVDKAVEAALEQIEAIRRLEAEGGLGALPEKLQTTAALRLEYPELTLAQLAERFDPPVSRSCLYHRLKKITELAGRRTETGRQSK
ncbi:MAG: DNA-binding protein WhiA [Oscillospiraceae bacterium]|nr:DNA-binding protein WhiA [Oscillospiraceae bacterium]